MMMTVTRMMDDLLSMAGRGQVGGRSASSGGPAAVAVAAAAATATATATATAAAAMASNGAGSAAALWGPERSVNIVRDPSKSLGISIVGGKVPPKTTEEEK